MLEGLEKKQGTNEQSMCTVQEFPKVEYARVTDNIQK